VSFIFLCATNSSTVFPSEGCNDASLRYWHIAKSTLEAVYTGGNLSIGQITQMTTGDGSTAAMNNQMWSYWGDNTVPALQA